jgi:hypothetical protein
MITGKDWHSQNMKITVLRNVILCDVVYSYHIAIDSKKFAEEPATSIFRVEEWSVKKGIAGSFETLVTKLPDYTASHPTRFIWHQAFMYTWEWPR